jgi:hypothetical protein|tara:strand:- start:265 stop:783 length:519 start_codon:yes stop_codon:yes gene_type:complete
MDLQFADIEDVGDEKRVYVKSGENKPMFKQFNNVRVEEVTEDSVVFNLQGNDISSYDDDIRASAQANSKEWFGRDVSEKTISKAYTSPVKNDVFETQVLKTVDGVNRVRVFDHEKNNVDFQNLTEGTICDVVVQLRYIWFVKRNFGPEWISVQLKTVKPPEKDPYEDYLFQD